VEGNGADLAVNNEETNPVDSGKYETHNKIVTLNISKEVYDCPHKLN
jgi:hypothetical protein